MSTVTILLSTYNGEKYICEQIDSLLNQKNVDVRILIRDDGSKDSTVSLIESYEDERITYYVGNNLGVVGSYMELLEKAPDSDYYAFCDQDDYWLDNKLEKAVGKLKDIGNPISLYCSSNTLVNEEQEPLANNSKSGNTITYGGILLKCCSIGCTYVFSKEALQYIRRKAINTKVMMHDAWVLRVIASVGEVVYDNDSYILYRQHDGNVVGSTNSKIGKWKGRIKRIRTFTNKNRGNAISELYETCRNDMCDSDKITVLEEFYNRRRIINRIRILFDKDVRCFSKVDTLILKIFVLFGVL